MALVGAPMCLSHQDQSMIYWHYFDDAGRQTRQFEFWEQAPIYLSLMKVLTVSSSS
jgi:hypothetical protein